MAYINAKPIKFQNGIFPEKAFPWGKVAFAKQMTDEGANPVSLKTGGYSPPLRYFGRHRFKPNVFPKKFLKPQKNPEKSIDFISLKRYTFKHQKQNRFRKDFKGYEKHESF